MVKRRRTRADVEAEIRRARDHGSPRAPISEGGAYPNVEDHYPNLDDADLAGVDLSRLQLEYASLKRADLRGAVLEDTNLSGAALNDADLTNTTRTRGANLTATTMYFARLGGADLSQAILRPEDSEAPSSERNAYPGFLDHATYNDDTRWPRRFDPKQYGARKAEPA